MRKMSFRDEKGLASEQMIGKLEKVPALWVHRTESPLGPATYYVNLARTVISLSTGILNRGSNLCLNSGLL